MTYDQVASISQVLALLFFIALFLAVLIYTFWPGNKKRFEEASKLPFDNEHEPNGEKDG